MSALVLAIDASNLRAGGGLTHLIELLSVAQPSAHNFSKVVIFGSRDSLSYLPDYPWLIKYSPFLLNKGTFFRILWHYFCLKRLIVFEGCNLLFSPGGSHYGLIHPVVTMSQNMLPFDFPQLFLYGFSLTTLRLLVLRILQSRSFLSAHGVIFLSTYACNSVQHIIGPLSCPTSIIPHGVNPIFFSTPKKQFSISHYSHDNPYRLIYVSTIDHYKHQWNIVRSTSLLRSQYNWPLQLHLVGSANPSALSILRKSFQDCDPNCSWVNYHGFVDSRLLPQLLSISDLGIFASSCENMPNILLQTMASGLPMACSSYDPMPEVLGSSGLYFDPLDISDIANCLFQLIDSSSTRAELASLSYASAQNYSWTKSADSTFSFLHQAFSNYTS